MIVLVIYYSDVYTSLYLSLEKLFASLSQW